MKEINIYSFGKCISNNDKKPGAYVARLEYKGVFKYIDGFTENTTTYRLIILGMIEAIKTLKEPCKINICNPTAVGLGKILTKQGEFRNVGKNKINSDLLNELVNVLIKGDHAINEVITKDKLSELKRYLKKYDNEFKKYNNELSKIRCSNNWNNDFTDNGIVPF